MIYLASPYTHTEKRIEKLRFDMTVFSLAHYFEQGWFVYSPIVHCHPVAMAAHLPTHFEFWQTYNHHMIELSSTMHVLMLEGWNVSKGVMAEIEYAKSLGKEIVYMKPVEDGLKQVFIEHQDDTKVS